MHRSNPKKPSSKLRLASKLAEVYARREEAFLSNLQSLGFRPSHPEGKSVDVVPVPLHELFEGRTVSGEPRFHWHG
jgi:hypothetical protein